LFTAGWAGAAVVVAVVVVLTLAVCWTIADSDRPGRLALLLTAWRGTTRRPRRAPGSMVQQSTANL
jgi:hypothetical protein